MNKVPSEVYRKIDEAETKGFKHCELPWDLATFEKIELNGQLKRQNWRTVQQVKGQPRL